MRTVKIVDATRRNVAPFGVLITRPGSRPTARTPLLDYWKQQARFVLPGGKGEVGFLVARAHRGIYDVLETHLTTPEILVPLNCDVNIAVAPPARRRTDTPEVKKLKAFRVKKGSAIMLAKGVWHYLPQPVGRNEAEILVVFADNTSARDLIMVELGQDSFRIAK